MSRSPRRESPCQLQRGGGFRPGQTSLRLSVGEAASGCSAPGRPPSPPAPVGGSLAVGEPEACVTLVGIAGFAAHGESIALGGVSSSPAQWTRSRQLPRHPTVTKSNNRAQRPAQNAPRVARRGHGRALEDPAMHSPMLESAVLGAIQGVTEFLPISSDGHLALTEMLFDFDSRGLALNVMLHVGTLAATLLMLWRSIRPALTDGLRACLSPSRFRATPGARDALVVILASVPTAVIGLTLRHSVERWTESPLAVGIGFLVTSCVLVASRFAREGAAEQPSVLGALLIGLAQGIAVLPGVSRSASTITLALFLGVRRERAFELSMLMSLPAVLGATILEAPKALAEPALVPPAAVGAFVAFLVGLLALGLLRRVVMSGKFSWFAAWVVPVGLATLALASAWPHG